MAEIFSGCAVRAVAQGFDPAARWQEGDDEFRWVLSERWAEGPMIGYVGMNPSDASDKKTDPTWMRWRGFSQRWGFGGQYAMNPVPKRSSSPEDAMSWLGCVRSGAINRSAIDRNIEFAHRYGRECAAWVIGWGDKGKAMDAIYRVHRDFLYALRADALGVPFLAFGLTASGNPKHVLARGTSRIPDDAPVFEYEHNRGRLAKAPFAVGPSQSTDGADHG